MTDVLSKDKDPSFVCLQCNKGRDSAHARHWILTAVAFMTDELLVSIAPRYPDKEKIQKDMEKLKKSVIAVFAQRLEVLKFIEGNIKSKTKLIIDYEILMALPIDFKDYLDDAEQLYKDREVLKFKSEIKKFNGFIQMYEQLLYLETVDDQFIVNHYRFVFTSKIAVELPKPIFKQKSNVDFYDRMTCEGILI